MPQVVIPLPSELLASIERLAERDERSRPAEIRYLLKQAVFEAEATQAPQAGEGNPA